MNLEDCGILREDILNGVVQRFAEKDIRKVVSEAKEQMSKQFQASVADIVKRAFK